MRAIKLSLPVAVLLALSVLSTANGDDDETIGQLADMTLITSNGDRIGGQWADGEDPLQVVWQSRDFVGPFQFPRDALTAIYGPRDEDAEGEEGNLSICELASGDVLLGSPLSLDDKVLKFAIESVNAENAVEILSIPRGELKRLTAPMAANEVLIDLPGDGQELLKNKRGQWELQGGELVAKSPDAKCFAKLPELPKRCMIEFVMSWDRGTDFSVSLSAQKREVRGAQQNNARFGRGGGNRLSEPGEHSGIRFETWDDQLVMLARNGKQADVLPIDGSAGKAGTLRLQVFIDAEKLSADVYREGVYAGQLNLPSEFKSDWARLSRVARLESFSGSLSLESYRVSSWNGHTPIDASKTESAVRMADGTNITGNIVGWDANSKEFIVELASTAKKDDGDEKKDEKEEDDKEKDAADEEDEDEDDKSEDDKSEKDEDEPDVETKRIAMDKMAEIIFGGSRTGGKRPDTKVEAGNISLATKKGSRFDGEFVGVKEGRVHVRSAALKQTASFAIDDVAAVNFSGADKPEEPDTKVVGTLRLSNSMIRGSLVEARTTDDATCLAWLPLAAANAVQLIPDSSGTIVYRATKPKVVAAKKPQPNQRRGMIAGFAQALKQVADDVDEKAAPSRATPVKPGDLMTLELRSGDSIPFRPKRIDEEGVTFESPLSKVTFVTHKQVKAISLRSRCTPAELTAIKRERFLTVPRRYKERPPTHLLLSVNKDILRGRLLSMDDKFVTIETALTPRRIPRERIAAIVWLDGVIDPEAAEGSGDKDADELKVEGGDETELAKAGSDGFNVLATKRGGQRITIIPDHCVDGVLHGKNPVLESCQLDLSQVDQLAFGGDIDSVIGKLAVSQIVLTAAPQPRFMDEEPEEGGGQAGQDSALVGKPAPPIELDRLNGKEYDLSEETGKIVVLDFWATWCGPCIQWMPRAEEIVNEFPEDNVELVAVNLAETAEEINPVLKRLELSPTVLLDIDGVVAAAYKATAIPQTVVIDREGKVDRVLVGGGKQNEERLRDAIKSLVNPGA